MVEVFGPEMVHLISHQLMCNKMTLIVAHELTSLASVSLGFLHFSLFDNLRESWNKCEKWKGGSEEI